MAIERRRLICDVPIAVFGLSGCLGWGSDGTTDLLVSNQTSNEAAVTIRVTQVDGDARLLDDTFTVAPDEYKRYEEVVSGSKVRVYLDVENGPENAYEWSDGESDAQGLHIYIDTDSITFSPVVA